MYLICGMCWQLWWNNWPRPLSSNLNQFGQIVITFYFLRLYTLLYSRDHKFIILLLYYISNSQWNNKTITKVLFTGDNIIFCFALLLPQMLDNFLNQDQFWNLLVLTISKHPLLVICANLSILDIWDMMPFFNSYDKLSEHSVWKAIDKTF